ncbi:MAG: hypothetical protein LBP23_08365 [Treponema sp.]|nr:hypothetical protein [Treponema sp.]
MVCLNRFLSRSSLKFTPANASALVHVSLSVISPRGSLPIFFPHCIMDAVEGEHNPAAPVKGGGS